MALQSLDACMATAASVVSESPLVHLVTFAKGEPFLSTQRMMDQSLHIAGINTHEKWINSIDTSARYAPLKKRVEAMKSQQTKRGGFWKPMLILDKMDRIALGEFVLFHDASQYVREPFRYDLRPLVKCIQHLGEDVLVGTRMRGTIEWAYSQCGVHYGDKHRQASLCEAWSAVACPGNRCCEDDIRHLAHLLNTWHIWRNTPKARRLLEQWQELSLSDVALRVPFLDQSLLELLAARQNLLSVVLPSAYISHLHLYPLWLYDESNLQKGINRLFDNLASAKLQRFRVRSGFEWGSLNTPAYLWRHSLNCSERKEAFEPCWSGGSYYSYRLCCDKSWGPEGNPNCWDIVMNATMCCRPRDTAFCIGGIDGLAVDEKSLWEGVIKPLDAAVIIQAKSSDSLVELDGMFPSAVALVDSCQGVGSWSRLYKRLVTLSSWANTGNNNTFWRR